MSLQTNPQLELAFDYVRNTNKSLFLTGKAGSGKTTFLHQIKAEGRKRLAVVAPTGVAAINAGGMTIHSLFQLPFGLHLPGVQRGDQQQSHRFSRKKINLIRSLDLLVIDEISMVRADLLDAVDDVLRRYRDRYQPFGGAQLLMIGDLHQLPPVVKPEEWDLLGKIYDTPWFFGSRALQQIDYISIELKHIYRQSDPEFISLLNQVRDNCLDETSLRKLNSRFIADFRPPGKDAYITLTATNAVANDINARNLQQLRGAKHEFKASIVGQFPPGSYPTEEKLELKIGAQVMFIKNDTATERKYFNGKIGRITDIDEEVIFVQCPGDRYPIGVAQAEWHNVKYELNEETKQIEERVLGMFVQYPLKLAWAITIHKSQGLTFERAIIDAQAAFASGQVYVALSRCKTFDGIVLRSRISLTNVKTDPVVKDFSEEADRNLPSESELQQAKREFQSSLLNELFSFDAIEDCISHLCLTYAQHAKSLPPADENPLDQMRAIAERADAELLDVARKFAPQLADYLAQEEMPEANQSLQFRIQKAGTYFREKIGGLFQKTGKLPTVSDNKEVGTALASQLRSFQLALFVKKSCFEACIERFATETCTRAKFNAELDFEQAVPQSARKKLVVPNSAPHPELYRQLLEWREQAAEQNGRLPIEVLPNISLRDLAAQLPTDNAGLGQISGIGKVRLRRYGKEISAIIQKYRETNDLRESQPDSRSRTQPRASETKRHSFELFRAGKSIDEIAAERSLTRGTIEGHLSHFIGLGQLEIHAVVDQESVDEIMRFMQTNPEATTAETKSHFGEKYGYGQLKMVMSYARNQS